MVAATSSVGWGEALVSDESTDFFLLLLSLLVAIVRLVAEG